MSLVIPAWICKHEACLCEGMMTLDGSITCYVLQFSLGHVALDKSNEVRNKLDVPQEVLVMITNQRIAASLVLTQHLTLLSWHAGRVLDLCQTQQRPELAHTHPLQPPALRQGSGVSVVAEQQGRDGPALQHCQQQWHAHWLAHA